MTEPIAKYKASVTEHEIQAAVIEWCLVNATIHPQLGMIYAIPNGANKSYTARKKFQAEGLRSGVPDLHLPVSSKPAYTLNVPNHSRNNDGDTFESKVYHSLYIELKRWDGRLSANQVIWKERLEKYDNCVVVCYTLDNALDAIWWYLGLRIEDRSE